MLVDVTNAPAGAEGAGAPNNKQYYNKSLLTLDGYCVQRMNCRLEK